MNLERAFYSTNYCIRRVHQWMEKHKPEQNIYRVVLGNDNRRWLYPINHPVPATNIFVEAHPRENERGYRGFRGFAGSTLTFLTEDRGELKLTGPWHSNSDALFEQTGVDLREMSITFGAFGLEHQVRQVRRGRTAGVTRLVWADRIPVIGNYYRIHRAAWEYKRNHPDVKMWTVMGSNGGGSLGPTRPPKDGKVISDCSAAQADIIGS